MLTYDKSDRTIYASQNDVAIMGPPEREVSIDYYSFQKYVDEKLYDNIMEMFYPRLCRAIGVNEDEFFIQDVKIDMTPDAGYFGDTTPMVYVKFGGYHAAGYDAEWVCICRLPSVDKNGIIKDSSGRRFSLIKTLEQEEIISYNEKKKTLKFKLPKTYIEFEGRPSKLDVKFSTIKNGSGKALAYDTIDLMFSISEKEGYDTVELFKLFKSRRVRNVIGTRDDLEARINLFSGNIGSIDASDYIGKIIDNIRGENSDWYNIASIREQLNELVSLRNCEGMKLTSPVYSTLNPDVLLASAGTILTDSLLDVFERECVYCIYTEASPNVYGKYLAELIHINFIPKGTMIIPEIVDYLPETETGMYVSKDYFLDDSECIIFDGNTLMSQGLVEFLKDAGKLEVYVSDKAHPSLFKMKPEERQLVFFQEEHISNRQFKASVLPQQEDISINGYYYLNAKNELVASDGLITTFDIAAVLSLYWKLHSGLCYERVVNIDSGFRKRLVMLDEQYERAFRFACNETFKTMSRTFREVWKADKSQFFIIDKFENKFYPMTKNFASYLKTNAKAFQMLSSDVATNPVSFISACTKANVYVPSANQVSDTQRRIPLGALGRIDVYEIPQSGKMGVVNNTTIGCKIDEDGSLKAGYYRVRHNDNGSFYLDTSEKVYLTVEEEEHCVITDLGALKILKVGDVYTITNPDEVVLCRVPTNDSIEKMAFSYAPIYSVRYVNCNALSTVCWATASIPFMGSNDAARAIFGVSQTKQAKGLVLKKRPCIGTYANKYIPMLNDEYCIIAKDSGVIKSIYKNTNGTTSSKIEIAVEYDNVGKEIYEFDEYYSSGYSVTVRTILCEVGDVIEKGDFIMTSNFIDDGYLALGRDALVGYLPTGYNYEDGVNIADKFCNELLSYRVNKHEVLNTRKDTTIEFENINTCYYIDSGSDVKFDDEGNVIKTDNVEIGKYHCKIDKSTGSSQTIYAEDTHGFLERCEVVNEKSDKGKIYTKSIEYDLVSIDPFGSGDKMANRHGNKGVNPNPAKNSQMPRLLNGQILDICYNPNGIPSRMNDGQIHECNLGLGLHILDMNCIADAFNTITNEEISQVVGFAVSMANSNNDSDIQAAFDKYPLVPMEVKLDAKENIDKVRFWKGCFNTKGEAYVINPKKGFKLSETPIAVGINHVYKLIQESDVKIHVRAGAMYGERFNTVGNAPPKGASAGGGQRTGEMEVDAYCAYGASALIEELQNSRGDNPIARNNLIAQCYLPDDEVDNYTITEYGRGQRRSTTQFLYTALALGLHFDCDNGEFQRLSYDNGEMYAYDYKTLERVRGKEELEYQKRKKEREKSGKDSGGKDSGKKKAYNASRSAAAFAALRKKGSVSTNDGSTT